MLDWLACVAGARGSEAGDLGCVISQRPWERTTYMGHALELGDVHRAASLHPGPVIWPAAISYESADMASRLDAAVRGYEAMIAVGMALGAQHHDRWDATTTCGMIGAAASFGSAIGFAPTEYAQAMGNAASVAGGLLHMRHDDVLTRQWHIFHAVRTGRDAALHVHYGATGPKGILEGPDGMFATMAQDNPMAQDMAQDIGPLGEHPGGWLMAQVDHTPLRLPDGSAAIGESYEGQVLAKLELLTIKGGLGKGAAERAARIALESDDAEELDRMLEDWLR